MFPPRDIPEITLAEIADQMAAPGDVINCLTNQVQIQLISDDPKVVIFDGGNVRQELPLAGSLDAFGTLVKAPAAFINRLEPDMQQYTLNELLRRNPGPIDIRYGEHSIMDVAPAGRKHIDPRDVVEVASNVVGEDAKVIEWWRTGWDMRLDVVVPGTDCRGAFGVPELDDYTLGGLRFSQALKHNLAPTVEEFWFRLACTNGYEYLDKGQRVDLRSHDEGEFLIEFEALAARKMRTVVEKIQAFYALRSQPVPSIEQAIIRHGLEHGLTDRVIFALVEAVPSFIDEGQEATMFDVVNLFTNAALGDGLKAGTRRDLEQMGGSICADHVSRCRTSGRLVA